MLKKLAQASFIILLASVPASTTYAANLISVTQSSASSGGITAGEGDIVVSTSSKSVSQVRTTIKSGEDGRVDTEVVVTKDGVTTRELHSEALAPGATTIINRSTSTASVRQRTDGKRAAPVLAPVKSTATTSVQDTSAEVPAAANTQQVEKPQALQARIEAWAVRFPVLTRILAFWRQL